MADQAGDFLGFDEAAEMHVGEDGRLRITSLDLDLVANGQLDALTTDNTILAGYAAQPAYKGKLKVVGQPFTKERYGIGLKKGDKDMCTKATEIGRAHV